MGNNQTKQAEEYVERTRKQIFEKQLEIKKLETELLGLHKSILGSSPTPERVDPPLPSPLDPKNEKQFTFLDNLSSRQFPHSLSMTHLVLTKDTDYNETQTEVKRMDFDALRREDWKKWGPYLSERQWGTVREDYSPNGDVWNFHT